MPATLESDVLVIGGGATGLGVVRDAAHARLRRRPGRARGPRPGHDRPLPRAAALGRALRRSRTRTSATECAEENVDPPPDRGRRRSRTPAGCSSPRPADDPAYARPLPRRLRERPACRSRRSTRPRRCAREPRLNPGITRAFDRSRRGDRRLEAVWGNAHAARGRRRDGPAPTTAVIDVLRDGDAVVGARLRDDRGGGEVRIEAGFTSTRAGVWAGQIADMAGDRGRRGRPRQGDHDRDEPPARLHGDQPLRRMPATATSSSRSGPSA